VSTGSDGYNFLKIDAGMTEVCQPLFLLFTLTVWQVLRPSLYGAAHPIQIFRNSSVQTSNGDRQADDETTDNYVVVRLSLPPPLSLDYSLLLLLLLYTLPPLGWPLLRIWRPHHLRPWAARDPRPKTLPSATDR
jgi:hypothetical protein